ncbi:ephexin-1 [Boleophthalmus pectinirostris]|uniref:ephexin-1 n=1 Tax=Boleophthalmus pectinirostris TaxID=150288 RepID=UPI000A1C4AA7|nr:ephexin-1 [Boleophthalmus pectinirostris]
MSVITLFFRGLISQENHPDKRSPPAPPVHEYDDDENDSHAEFTRDANLRKSWVRKSMRKKKQTELQVPTEIQKLDHSPSRPGSSSSNGLPPKSPTRLRRMQITPLPSDSRLGGGKLPSQSPDNPSSIAYRPHFSNSQFPHRTSIDTGARTPHHNPISPIQTIHGSHRGGDMRGSYNNNRLPSNGESNTVGLNIIKNIEFLYQEYRDSSKQQEIEQRRHAESLSPGEVRRTGSDSSSVPPPSLQLQLRNTTHSLSLWQNLEVVQNSGLLLKLPQKEVIMQEAMFELVSSEASYYKSLEILETHFLRNPILVNTLSQSDMHFLFSNIEDVMKASERFLMDLEHRIEESILISDVCDIVYSHAMEHFNVFIIYVTNQNYQEKNYRRILEGNQAFREVMETLEKHPRVRGLSFTSFLILPFQRITRLKLLVQNILKKAEEGSEREANAIKAHQRLEQIVKDCNEGVRKMGRTEELISIEKTLEFKSKSIPIISHSRWLLKKGEVQLMSGPKSTRTTKGKKLYQPVYLFLFNNLLLITKRNSSGDRFQVLDSCTRAMLRTDDLEDQGQLLANVFNLRLLENQEERPANYMLKTTSMSDKLRWMCALTPSRRTRFMSTSAHQSDSPQVQCIQSYSSQEPDELSIEMADVLNLLERTDDGWMMGERLHDGERGWFPSRVVEEIQSKEVRIQNLREAFRIHQAQEGVGFPQSGRTGPRAGRRTPKNFSNTWSDQ